MRLLLLSDAGDGLLDTGLRAKKAGHQVKMFCRKFDAKTRPIGKGLIDLIPDWRIWARWSDLILLEGNSVYMSEMDRWRREGCRIIGGNTESAAWETDRPVGMRVFKKADIAVPPYREFTDYDQAIAYVKRTDAAYVSKPCGSVDDKSLSYVAKSPKDLLFMLGRWKRKHKGRPPCPFVLQEKIEGNEFAVGGWWGPSGFATGWEENFEHKKLMPKDLGPNTGEMGTVSRIVRNSKLADKVLAPLEAQLEELGYVGNVDVNCIVDKEGNPWPLEFTMRFGWPAWNIETSLFRGDPIEFLGDLCGPSGPKSSYRAMDQIACGVVLAIPPFPGDPKNYEDVVGVPLYEDLGEGFHPCEMMAAAPEDEAWMATAGTYAGVAVGTGATLREAQRAAYRILDGVEMPASPFWRHDIGERVRKMLPALQENGFARGME